VKGVPQGNGSTLAAAHLPHDQEEECKMRSTSKEGAPGGPTVRNGTGQTQGTSIENSFEEAMFRRRQRSKDWEAINTEKSVSGWRKETLNSEKPEKRACRGRHKLGGGQNSYPGQAEQREASCEGKASGQK